MNRCIIFSCVFLLMMLIIGCTSRQAVPAPSETADIILTPSTPSTTNEPTISQYPFWMEDYDGHGAPDGITALEFSDRFPVLEESVEQLGEITELTNDRVTFKELVWLEGDDLPEGYEGPYEIEPTGEIFTYELIKNVEIWILWSDHVAYPARISVSDFSEYSKTCSWPVFRFYSVNNQLVMISEQYTG